MEWGLGRGLALPQDNKMNFILRVCCNSCDALLADLQGTCETRPALENVRFSTDGRDYVRRFCLRRVSCITVGSTSSKGTLKLVSLFNFVATIIQSMRVQSQKTAATLS